MVESVRGAHFVFGGSSLEGSCIILETHTKIQYLRKLTNVRPRWPRYTMQKQSEFNLAEK